MTDTTSNFGFSLPDFNVATWHDELNGNFESIDTLIATTTGLTGIMGAWQNSTTYAVGNRVIDNDTGTLWIALVNHTSAATGTFEEDRLLHPTYWEGMGSGWSARGQWQNSTAYKIGDTAYDETDYLYAVCIANHVSNGAGNLRADIANWVILMDGAPTVQESQAARLGAEAARDAAIAAQLLAEDAEADTAAIAGPINALYVNFQGGLAGQVLAKDTGTDYDFSWVSLPGGGDMLKSTYDPTNINASAFARANHTGTQGISTIQMNTARLLGRTTGAVGAVEEMSVGSGLTLSAGSLVTNNTQIKDAIDDMAITWTGVHTYNNDVTFNDPVTFTDAPVITSTVPHMKFITTSAEDNFWVYVDNNNFYILTDRDQSGNFETPHPAEWRNANEDAYFYGYRVALGGGKASQSRADLGLGGLSTMDLADLYYTGSNQNNLSFPITTHLYVRTEAGTPSRNVSQTIYLRNDGTTRYTNDSGNSGGTVTGTWRSRGNDATNGYNLFQRTA